MVDVDDTTTTKKTEAQVDSDSGLENKASRSDSSKASKKSEECRENQFTGPTVQQTPTCIFEETSAEKSDTQHICRISFYSLSGKCIETFSPKTFLYLKNCVRVLDLSVNKLCVLPDSLGELRNLQELNLSHNKLQVLPDSLSKLNKLKVFNLAGNKFLEPPLCLELGMCMITNLDLSSNILSDFRNAPKCLPYLQRLNLNHNCLNLLPLWLLGENCRSLVELDVSFNYPFDDPSLRRQLPFCLHYRVSALKCLRKLDISNTGSNSQMVAPLAKFEGLQCLYMGNVCGSDKTFNHFSEINWDLFHNPGDVVEFHLPKVGLAGLPEDLDRFANLQVLDVSCNPLDWLPDSFGQLVSLRELVLSECNLSSLPDSFNELTNLNKLTLSHNKLADVRAISGFPCLSWLDLYDNCLEELPVSIDELPKLQMVDLAQNYLNLESALNIGVNGESVFEVYCRQQARLRRANNSEKTRNDGFKVVQETLSSRNSLESLHNLHFRSESSSDSYCTSEPDDEQSYQNCVETYVEGEENWDEDSVNEDDDFEPDSVYRYALAMGKYKLGWTPPVKQRNLYQVPVNLRATGHVFEPRMSHAINTFRRKKKWLANEASVEGQFDETELEDAGRC